MVRFLLILLGSAWLGGVLYGAPLVVEDDGGLPVWLEAPAQRIVSLAPGLTEAVFSIGAGERLVAVDSASDYPAAARGLPRLGSGAQVDLERLLALRPDLVLAWQSGSSPRLLARLRAAGIAVYVSEPRRLGEIATTLERLGQLTGRRTAAAEQAATFRRRLRSLQRRYARARPVAVFYQVWADPLITVNGEQFISEVIRLCGGANVFAGLDVSAPRISVEAVLARDPAVIVAGASPAMDNPLAYWRAWPQLRAVRHDHLFEIPADLLQRPSVRLLDGAELLCERLERVAGSELPAHR